MSVIYFKKIFVSLLLLTSIYCLFILHWFYLSSKIALTGYIFFYIWYLIKICWVFWVPESCWATVRYDNSISADVREDTIKKRLERRLLLLFSDNLAVGMEFLALQDKNNIRTLSVNSTPAKQTRKARQRFAFLTFLKLVQTNFILLTMYVYLYWLFIKHLFYLSSQIALNR